MRPMSECRLYEIMAVEGTKKRSFGLYLFELTQEQGHPKRLIAKSMEDAIAQKDPKCGKLLVAQMWDDRDVEELDGNDIQAWLEGRIDEVR